MVVKGRQYQCPDIAYSSSVAFTEYIQKLQYDSAQKILNYWEGKCGICEPILRARFVLAFVTEQSVDSLIANAESLHFLHYYWYRAEMIKSRDFSRYYYNQSYFGFVPIGQEFDSFTISFFKAAYIKQQPGTTKFLLSEVYSNNSDSLFTIIQADEYKGSSLAKEYYKIVDKYKNKPELNTALLVGIWIPTGRATKLGIHPELGVQLGSKYRKINIDLTIAFKFLRSKTLYNAVRVRSDKSVVLTDKFFGGYMGIDIGYDVWNRRGQEVQALFGAGVDGFDAIDQDTVKKLKAESTWTYNFNFGIGYRYYINNSLYIGLRAKYNIVDYSLRGVIDFTGNPVTLTFCIGGLSNKIKRYGLEALKYKWRR